MHLATQQFVQAFTFVRQSTVVKKGQDGDDAVDVKLKKMLLENLMQERNIFSEAFRLNREKLGIEMEQLEGDISFS